LDNLLARACRSLFVVAIVTRAAVGAQVTVTVLDAESSEPVAGAALVVQDSLVVQTTNAQGQADLVLPAGAYYLTTQCLGYALLRHPLVVHDRTAALTLRLVPLVVEVPGTEVRAPREVPAAGHVPLPVAMVRQCPDPSPDPLRFVKILPGVSSGNDQSSTYRVHGGAPSDNLVSLNGLELLVPLQARHGLAESFSLINPDLLRQADFYAGYVPVRYGDRVGSVLDAWYRPPDAGPGTEIDLGTVQQSLTAHARLSPRWRLVSGLRRVDLGRLASGLQVTGQYEPRGWDWQTLLVWNPAPRTQVSLLSAVLRSHFVLTPTSQTLLYNCGFAGCDRFYGEGEGDESYRLDTDLLGLRAARQYQHGEAVAFASVQRHDEQEDTDVAYVLRWQPKSARTPSTAGVRSVEQYLSRLRVWRGQAGVQLRLDRDQRTWEAGLGAVTTDTEGHANGLSQVISTQGAYALAYVGYQVDQCPTDLYLYGQCRVPAGRVTVTPAVRVSRFGATGQTAVLPRGSAECAVGRGWTLGAAAGRQAQPPQYGELAAAEPGARLQAQQVDQASIWVDGQIHPALAWRSEVYYRLLRHLMPYAVDDVRVSYSGRSDARGRAWGWTTLFRGQLGPATGMISYTYLVAREDLADDGLGEMPAPGDQRHTLS
jgi:hypothetical protein